MSILQCTRQSVHNYVKDGKIKVIKLPNGRYIYNKEDVYKLAYKDIQRKTYLYARVSTNKQKKDLENQVNIMKQRSEEHTSELQSRQYLVCRLLLEKKKTRTK